MSQSTPEMGPSHCPNGRLGQDLGFGGFAFSLKFPGLHLPEWLNTNLVIVIGQSWGKHLLSLMGPNLVPNRAMNLGAQLGPMSINKLSRNWACQMGPIHSPNFFLSWVRKRWGFHLLGISWDVARKIKSFTGGLHEL